MLQAKHQNSKLASETPQNIETQAKSSLRTKRGSLKFSILAKIEELAPAIAEIISFYLTPIIEKVIEKAGDKLAEQLNPLSELEALELAYEKRWVLTTSQLSVLLSLSPQTIIKYRVFEQRGFVFSRAGKVNSEIGWIVQKTLFLDDDY